MFIVLGWLLIAMVCVVVLYISVIAGVWRRPVLLRRPPAALESPVHHREDTLRRCLTLKQPHLLVFAVRWPSNRLTVADFLGLYQKRFPEMEADQVKAAVQEQLQDCLDAGWISRHDQYYAVTHQGRDTLRRLTA